MTTAPDKAAKTPEAPEKEVRAEQALSGATATAVDDAPAIDAALADTMEPSGETLPAPEPLQAELEQALLREQLAGVTVDFFFAPHSGPEDMRGLDAIIKRADIVVFESADWDETERETFNGFAELDMSNSEDEAFFDECTALIEDPLVVHEMRLIVGTGKPVLFPDIPKDHPISEESKRLSDLSYETSVRATDAFYNGDYDSMLELEKRVMELHYEEQRLREGFIVKELARQIKEAKDANPELIDKDGGVHVAVKYGSAHKTLFHDLQRAGVSTTATMGYSLDTLPHAEEITRRMYFGKEVPEELYARNLFMYMYWETIKNANPGMNDEQAILIARKSLDLLSAQDLRDLSTQLGKIETWDDKDRARHRFFSDRGAIMPDTDAEIREILGPAYNKYTRLATAA